MKKVFLKVVFMFMFVISGLSFGAEKLYVGTNAEFEPFEYLQNGEIVGFDVDLMEEIAKITGKEIIWKNIAFDGLLPALQTKKIDVIIAGMTATEERKKFVNFSQTYYESNQMMLINKENPVVKSFDELKGHHVGVVLGYTGDIAVSEIEGVKVHRYNGTSEAIMALKAQKVEVVVLDSEPAKNYAKQNPELELINTDVAKEEYAIAVRKTDEALVEDIDKALVELKANGTYDKLIKKYFSDK
ncbi:Arginine-binding extracellular protein ArtP precursor [Fusobacterium necrogenes]|uniref:Arginine-binding extracellular protein ArtP n=1 Tax=Fusobacterium necrogenes TaxID=858 RepID=A0A377GUN5_9FUSO|nr:basic amino acid ABC transporter substrate-binding protein [Fusobacterium necrogenes]STO30695.1 Arginine-binding extracellular protein ArtP precursor [Fusobacterium necrogenes]